MAVDNTGPGQVEVTFEYSRHVGPRFVHGAVTLLFDALQPYQFVSKATWPTTDNYEAAIRKAVEQVLIEHRGSLENTLVALKRVGWDDVASCEMGFVKAARAATKAAFEV
jgi:hypothetical protein